MKPYTYLIGWSNIDAYYYGVQYGLTSDPQNLWLSYFTSSETVKEYRQKYGEPDIIQVRKIFDCPEKAKNWELKVLQRMHVVLREDFLNRNAAFAPPPNNRGKLTEETKKKISNALKGKSKSKEHAKKCRENVKKLQKENTKKRKGKTWEEIFGKQKSQEMKSKISLALSKQTQTEEEKQKRINSRRDGAGWRLHSSETKQKISQSMQGKRLYTDGKVRKFFVPGSEPSEFISIKEGKK